MNLDEHLRGIPLRHPFQGLDALVADLRTDPQLMQACRNRAAAYAAMAANNRLSGCWISQQTRTALLAALAAAEQKAPGVPAEPPHV